MTSTKQCEAMQVDGEQRKADGVALAASCKVDLIAAGTLAMLDALLASPDGTATIDDATADLSAEFKDGGRWRGRLLARSPCVASLRPMVSPRAIDRAGTADT